MKSLLRAVCFMVSIFSFSLPAFAETAPMPAPKAVHQAPISQSVNINTADAQTIANAKIKGIGKKRAEAIVAYRQQHGPFKSVDDLKNIKGLSDKVIDANRDRLTLV